jgi:hypothetical protein
LEEDGRKLSKRQRNGDRLEANQVKAVKKSLEFDRFEGNNRRKAVKIIPEL